MSERALRWAGLLSLLLSGGLFADQAWMFGKATLAHALIDRAYEEHVQTGELVIPWSWADMHPIARLSDPQRGITRHVLTGSTGTTLAFGIGHVDGTALPNSPGRAVLAGHRDREFAFLERVRLGDTLELHTRESAIEYRVVGREIVHESDISVLDPEHAGRSIVLLTCYPFDELTSGPLRLAIYAVEVTGRS